MTSHIIASHRSSNPTPPRPSIGAETVNPSNAAHSRASLFVAGLALLLLCAPARGEWVKTHDWNTSWYPGGIVCAPSDARRVYAFGDPLSWILVSDDGGVTWSKSSMVCAPAAQQCDVTDIAVDPLQSDTVYVAASELWGPALYKSSDAGAHFELLGPFSTPAIDPHDSRIVYANRPQDLLDQVPGGIVKSLDGGVTWSEPVRVDLWIKQLVIDPTDQRIVYAVGVDLPNAKTIGLYRTLDGGATWPRLFEALKWVRSLTVDARSRLYCIYSVMFTTQLLRSTNLGEGWSAIPIDIPPMDTPEGPILLADTIAVDPRRNETLYVASETHGILVSNDDGATWEILGYLPNSGTYTYGVTVTGDGVVLAALSNGIYRWAPPPPRRRAVSVPTH